MCYNQDFDPTALTCIEAQGDDCNKYCPDCIDSIIEDGQIWYEEATDDLQASMECIEYDSNLYCSRMIDDDHHEEEYF